MVTLEITSAESRVRFLTESGLYSGFRSRKREMGRRFMTTGRMATLRYVGLVTEHIEKKKIPPTRYVRELHENEYPQVRGFQRSMREARTREARR